MIDGAQVRDQQERDELGRQEQQDSPFDFGQHRRTAVEEYLRVRPRYAVFATAVREILAQALVAKGITVNSIEARAKEPESFGKKSRGTIRR